MNKQAKLKSNNQEAANKSIEKYEGLQVPEEINENEKHLYHVAILESNFNQAELKVDHKMRIQTFTDRAWLKMGDKLKRIGISNAYIFHNPKNVENVEEKKTVIKKVEDYNTLMEAAIELGFKSSGKKPSLKTLGDFILKMGLNPISEEQKEAKKKETAEKKEAKEAELLAEKEAKKKETAEKKEAKPKVEAEAKEEGKK